MADEFNPPFYTLENTHIHLSDCGFNQKDYTMQFGTRILYLRKRAHELHAKGMDDYALEQIRVLNMYLKKKDTFKIGFKR